MKVKLSGYWLEVMYVVVSQLLNRDLKKTKHLTKTSKQNQKRKKKEKRRTNRRRKEKKRQGGFIYIYFFSFFISCLTSLVAQTVKLLPTIWEIWVQSLGWKDLLEKEMTTHFSTLAWKIPWKKEPCRLQSTGSQGVDTTKQLHFHF